MPVSIPVTDLPDLPELPVFDWQWPQVVLFQPPQVPAEWVQVMEHNEDGRLAFTDEFLDLMAGTSWNGHQKFICTLVGQSIGGADPGWYEHLLDYWGGWQGEPELGGFPDDLDVAPQGAVAYLQANYWKMQERGATEAQQVRDVLRASFAHLWLPRPMLAQFHDRLVLDDLHPLESAALERAPDGSFVFRKGPEFEPAGYRVFLVDTGLDAEDAMEAVEREGGLIPESLHHGHLTATLLLPEAAVALAERQPGWKLLRYEP